MEDQDPVAEYEEDQDPVAEYEDIKLPANTPDWQCNTANITERLQELYRRKHEGDVTFSVTDCDTHEKEVISAHGLIVSMTSSTLSELLQLPHDHFVYYGSVTLRGFRHVLKYCYCNNVELQDVHEALETIHAANKFKMFRLTYVCEAFIQQSLRSLRTSGSDHSVILRHISNDVFKFFESRWFTSLNQDLAIEILKAVCLDNHPTEVFLSAVRWSKMRTGLNYFNQSLEHIRRFMEPFLPIINFLGMTRQQFNQHVIPVNVLTAEERTAIEANLEIENQPLSNLPTWCKRLNEFRSYRLSCNLITGRSLSLVPVKQITKHGVRFSVNTTNCEVKLFLSAISLPICACPNWQKCTLSNTTMGESRTGGSRTGTLKTILTWKDTIITENGLVPNRFYELSEPFYLNQDIVYILSLNCLHFQDVGPNVGPQYFYQTDFIIEVSPNHHHLGQLELSADEQSGISTLHIDANCRVTEQ